MRLSGGDDLLVSLQGLRKHFAGKIAVADLSLDLAPGEILGFVGPNGAGKTTSLRMIAGLLKPDGGRGVVLGHNLLTAPARVNQDVGYMSQALGLYADLTVEENLRFRADIYDVPEPKAAVSRVLDEHGLADRARQRAGRLSGGWARRLQLAACLIHRPRLVLLDEPTAGLDIETRRDAWRRIAALARSGVGIIVNTHDLLEAERCHRVAVFNEGRVLAVGAPAELTARLSAERVVICGAQTERLLPELDGVSGLLWIDSVPGRLTVFAPLSAASAVDRLATARGAEVTRAPGSLEDVSLALAAGVSFAEAHS